MKNKLIEAIKKVPIAGKTYEEFVEAVAEKLIDEDYRKASEVVWEIFDKVDEIAYRYLNDADYSGGDMIYDLNELKKKYTEEGK